MEDFQTEINFTTEQINKFRQLLKDEKVTFFFYPLPELRQLTLQGTHPCVKMFPPGIVKGVLYGNTITLTKEIILQYIEKTLEEPWRFMLSKGEIRVRSDEGGFIHKQKGEE